MNNAGTAGIGVDGDVTIIQEMIERDVASVFADGQVRFWTSRFIIMVCIAFLP